MLPRTTTENNITSTINNNEQDECILIKRNKASVSFYCIKNKSSCTMCSLVYLSTLYSGLELQLFYHFGSKKSYICDLH